MSTKLINNEINSILFPAKTIQKQHKYPQEIMKQTKNVKEIQESPNEKLKNYLTPIISSADLLSQEILGKLSKPQKEKIELIKEQANKIINYFDAIKNENVLQQESVKLPDQVQELELNPQRGMLQEMITQITLNKKIPVESNIDPLPKEIIKIRNKSKNILVIYKNDYLCKMFGTCLKKEGHNCTCVVDGRNGLSLIETGKFDVVLLGLALPEFSGYDIINVLEKNGKLRKSNIIILSASQLSQSEIEDLLKRGVYSYLKQPVKPEILLEIVKAV